MLFNYLLGIASWFIPGFNFSIYAILYSAYMQSTTEKELPGRTASNLYVFRGVSTSAGAIYLPLIISEYGVMKSFEYFGTFIIIVAMVVVIFVPSIRNMPIGGNVDTTHW